MRALCCDIMERASLEMLEAERAAVHHTPAELESRTLPTVSVNCRKVFLFLNATHFAVCGVMDAAPL